jgi:hypothetical protein
METGASSALTPWSAEGTPEGRVALTKKLQDDNRPENLELWVRPQPAGIRSADALAWSREIIRLYGVD